MEAEDKEDRYIDLDKSISYAYVGLCKYQNTYLPTPRTEQKKPITQTPAKGECINSLTFGSRQFTGHQQTVFQQSYNDAYNLIRQRKFDEAE